MRNSFCDKRKVKLIYGRICPQRLRSLQQRRPLHTANPIRNLSAPSTCLSYHPPLPQPRCRPGARLTRHHNGRRASPVPLNCHANIELYKEGDDVLDTAGYEDYVLGRGGFDVGSGVAERCG